MYTSQKFSKLLAENGCKLESGMELVNHYKDSKFIWELMSTDKDYVINKKYPAYDILNDICVKYAKEMFGGDCMLWRADKVEMFHTILLLLQQNKIQEAEDYIWEHCKFNPKNK